MKIGNVHYGAPQVVRALQDGADIATTAAGLHSPGADFVKDLTIINAAGHGAAAGVNLIRAAKNCSDSKNAEAGKNLLIAMGDGIAAAGYAGVAGGLGWPCFIVAGAGSLLANIAEASAYE